MEWLKQSVVVGLLMGFISSFVPPIGPVLAVIIGFIWTSVSFYGPTGVPHPKLGMIIVSLSMLLGQVPIYIIYHLFGINNFESVPIWLGPLVFIIMRPCVAVWLELQSRLRAI